MLYTNGFLKHSELDNWGNGCTGECNSYFVEYPGKFKDKQQAIEFIKNITGEIDEDSFEFNACDEPGRVDVQVQENENGDRLTQQEWDDFKQGKINSYLVTYSFYFKQLSDFEF